MSCINNNTKDKTRGWNLFVCFYLKVEYIFNLKLFTY